MQLSAKRTLQLRLRSRDAFQQRHAVRLPSTAHPRLRRHGFMALSSTRNDGAAMGELTPNVSKHGTSLEDPLAEEARRQAFIMQDTCSFLASDLKQLFEKGEITESRYSPNIVFEDPISKYNSRDGYVFNIRLLRSLFDITFDLHSISVSGPDAITARWTMGMRAGLLPWKPNLTFTGSTVYRVDPASGLILSHTDYWDALQRNAFPSLEGLAHVVRMAAQLQLTPGIETPKYVVLRKFKDYEIRRYDPYVVAEIATTRGSGPASGSGFSELASYLFGGNSAGLKMQMTTPVLTRVEAAERNESVAMQFVMESRYPDTAALPAPSDPRIATRRQEGGYAAALTFPGWPLDFEVVQAERQLRDLLLRDQLRPAPAYLLARYNDPATPPGLRRNEVLIALPDFTWPPPE